MPQPPDRISVNRISNASGGDAPTPIPVACFGPIPANPIRWGPITTSILQIKVQWGTSSRLSMGTSRECWSLFRNDPSGPSAAPDK